MWLDPADKQFYTYGSGILTWQSMLSADPDSPLGRYVVQLREWGFNGVAMYGAPEDNPEAVRRFCRLLKEQGIGLFIRREWNETEHGRSWPVVKTDARPRSSRKLSPYEPEVRAYWEERVRRDYEMFPDLAGYRVNGTEFYFINGAPWMGEGAEFSTRTGRECVRDAIRMMGDLLAAQGGTLFWESCQDDPSGQRQELHYFRDLTGEIPDNSYVVIKRYYWDFHPRWPRHPLYDVITKTPTATRPTSPACSSRGSTAASPTSPGASWTPSAPPSRMRRPPASRESG